MEGSQSLAGKAPVRMAERKSCMRTSEIDERNTVKKDEGKGWQGNSLQELDSVGSYVAGHRGLLKVIFFHTEGKSQALPCRSRHFPTSPFGSLCSAITMTWKTEPDTHGWFPALLSLGDPSAQRAHIFRPAHRSAPSRNDSADRCALGQ